MFSFLGERKQAPAPKDKMLNYSAPFDVQASNSSQQSCVTSGSSLSSDGKMDAIGTQESKAPDWSNKDKCTKNVRLACQTSGATSGSSAVEEDNSIVQPKIQQGQSLSSKAINGIDISRIRELRRKKHSFPSNNLVENLNLEIDSEAWVEREIEMGI